MTLLLSDALLEGLVHELPAADEYKHASVPEQAATSADDLDELRSQPEALSAD